jgi:molybdate transport system regulatory protein
MSSRVTLRIDFDGERRLGPGKIALLEAIERKGSIAAAGREFGMAYRRAWLLVDALNHMFNHPVVETRGGGKDGGGAVLTDLGAEIVSRYRAIEAKARKGAAAELKCLEQLLAPAPLEQVSSEAG